MESVHIMQIILSCKKSEQAKYLEDIIDFHVAPLFTALTSFYSLRDFHNKSKMTPKYFLVMWANLLKQI